MRCCSTALFAAVAWLGIAVAAQSPVRLLSVFHINAKKPVHVVSDRFLSFTLEPEVLLHVAACKEVNASLNLIRSLAPAYLRIAGPDSNRLLFQSLQQDNKALSEATNSHTKRNQNTIVSGAQWLKFNEFINNTGMNLIVSLNGGILDRNSNLDLSNALEFITFSNKNNLNTDWQLGFELQRIANDDGRSSGHDVVRLRKILEVFPRYQKSLILGPDLTGIDGRYDITFARNYLTEAQNALNVFTLHPDFSNTNEQDDVYEILSQIFAKMDNYLWMKEGALKTPSKGVVPKKSVWIAESGSKDSFCPFSDTMSLVKRLGSAATLGASVYLRKPHLLSLCEPTSEYWVSVLFKALVGKTVLDMRLVGGNSTRVHAFSHCTRIQSKPEGGIINPAVEYERGSVTVFGVNTGSEPSRLSLKMGFRSEETVHLYALTEDETDGMQRTLLNKQPLGLSPEKELPMLSPKIRDSTKYVVVPPRSVFFVVLPYAKSRACMSSADNGPDGLKNKLKPSSQLDEGDALEGSSLYGFVLETLEDGAEAGAIYVSYPKRGERTHGPALRGDQPGSSITEARIADSRLNTKFTTYSDDNTWMSTFPDKLREVLREQIRLNKAHRDLANRKDIADKLKAFEPHVVGQVPPTTTSITPNLQSESESQTEAATVSAEKTETEPRYRRSVPVVEIDYVPVLQLSGLEKSTVNLPSQRGLLESTPWVAVDANEVQPAPIRSIVETEPLVVSGVQNTILDPFGPRSLASAIVQEDDTETLSDPDLASILVADDVAETRVRRNATDPADVGTQKSAHEVLRPLLENAGANVADRAVDKDRVLSENTRANVADEAVDKDVVFFDALEQATKNLMQTAAPTELPTDLESVVRKEANNDDETKIRANREASIGHSRTDDFANIRRLANSVHPVSPFARKHKSAAQPRPIVKKDTESSGPAPVERSPQDSSFEATSDGKSEASYENAKPITGNTFSATVTSSAAAFTEQQDSEIISASRATSESKPLIEETKSDSVASPLAKHHHLIVSDSKEDGEAKVSTPPIVENANSGDPESMSTVGVSLKPTFRAKNARKVKTKKTNPLRRDPLPEADVRPATNIIQPNRLPTIQPIVKPSSRPIVSPFPAIKPNPLPTARPTTGRSAKSVSELIEISKARIKELIDIERAKIEELKEKINDRAAARDRNTPGLRNKREVFPVGRQSSFLHPLHSDHSAVTHRPMAAQFTGNVPSRAASTHHRRVERDLAEDACTKAKEVYEDLSKEAKDIYGGVKRTLTPVANWFEKNVDTIKSELSRKKRDVGATNPVNNRSAAGFRAINGEISHPRTVEAVSLNPRSNRFGSTVATRYSLPDDHATSRKPTTKINLRRKVRPGTRIQRDLDEDACKSAIEMYNDLSDEDKNFYADLCAYNTKHSLTPLTDLYDRSADDASSELLPRDARDVNAVKLRLKERRESLHKQIDELRKQRAERRAKMAEERQRIHSRPVRDVQHHTCMSGLHAHRRSSLIPGRADEPKTRHADEGKRNKPVWKNHTAQKDLQKDTKSHLLHKRDVEHGPLNAHSTEDRFNKNQLSNEILSNDINELEYEKPIAVDGAMFRVNKSKFESNEGDHHSLNMFLPEVEGNNIKDELIERHDPTHATVETVSTIVAPTSANDQTCDHNSYFSYLWCRCRNLFSYVYSYLTG